MKNSNEIRQTQVGVHEILICTETYDQKQPLHPPQPVTFLGKWLWDNGSKST